MRRFLAATLCLAVLLSGCYSDESGIPPEAYQTDASSAVYTEASTQAPTEMPEPTVPVTETVPPTEPVAERVSEGVQVQVNGNNYTGVLSDDNHYTKKQLTVNHTLRVVSERPFSALYVEWDRIPGVYSIVWENGSVGCGAYDFLHEYVRLPEAVNEVEFVFEDDADRVVCEVQLYTAGTAPEGVQDWLPPCEQADILVFPTHSDDDVLFFGPLISHYAIEEGLTVQTAFMVEHTGKWERPHERLNGLWELGVRHYPILGDAPDTGKHDMGWGLNFYEKSDIPLWQITQIRRFKPLVVVGHDLEGEYGNAGHKVNAYYLTQTISAAADPEQDPDSAALYGVWDTPKLYLHLYTENQWYFDVNTPMENDPQNRTPFEVAEDALKCHVSQIQGGLHMYQSDEAYDWDCRPFGLYRSLVGEDTTADIMENIDRDEWR